MNAPAGGTQLLHCQLEHLDRIASRVGRIGVGEQGADVPQRRSAEDGVGDGVRDRIAVRMAVEMDVGRNPDAAERQWTASGEAMGVVADAGARNGTTVGRHAAATATGAMIE